MSEGNGYATKEALEQRRGKRRFKPFEWSSIGRLILQSPSSAEWVRIDAARTRVRMFALGGKIKEHEQATEDFMLQTLYGIPLDQNHQPFFTPADKELILSLDPVLTDELVTACIGHCEQDEPAAEAAQKNLSMTNGESLPSASGTT